jgi:maleate isomerase
MRTGIYGWRARVGYAGQSPLSTTPYEFWKMAPDGVAMVCTGLHIDSKNEDLERACEDVVTAAGALDKFDLDFIALGVVPFYWSRLTSIAPHLQRQLQGVTKSKLLFPEDSICDALASLDATSVALVSPYKPQENSGIAEALAARGYGVTTIVTAGPDQNQPRYDGVYELCAELARKESADVIYVAGDRWPVAPHIDRLEAEFGIKVVGETQAILASVLRKLGIKERVAGFGKLLQSRDASAL